MTLAISTGGASPALARKLRETLSANSALEWADLAGVLSRARSQVKELRVVVDPQRWQCCLTPDLLQSAQAGKEDEALATLISNLLDGAAPGLCPQVDRCRPGGCRSRPQEPPE